MPNVLEAKPVLNLPRLIAQCKKLDQDHDQDQGLAQVLVAAKGYQGNENAEPSRSLLVQVQTEMNNDLIKNNMFVLRAVPLDVADTVWALAQESEFVLEGNSLHCWTKKGRVRSEDSAEVAIFHLLVFQQFQDQSLKRVSAFEVPSDVSRFIIVSTGVRSF